MVAVINWTTRKDAVSGSSSPPRLDNLPGINGVFPKKTGFKIHSIIESGSQCPDPSAGDVNRFYHDAGDISGSR